LAEIFPFSCVNKIIIELRQRGNRRNPKNNFNQKPRGEMQKRNYDQRDDNERPRENKYQKEPYKGSNNKKTL